jgi:oligopeptide/dipeptide ABC transporter ATP-binding protein
MIETVVPPSDGGDPALALVTVEDLCKHYVLPGLGRERAIKSVDGISFTIRDRSVLGLVGESGCGKSTLARLLLRLTTPTRGSIKIDGKDISRLRGRELKRMRQYVQLVFQNPASALDPRMRIGASMEAPLSEHGMGSADRRRTQVLSMLSEVGLDPSFYDRYPAQCSGGQLQRVVIGRALLLRPYFLVCDEPTSALDASMRTQVLNLLMDLKRRFSLTILMISHDLRVVRYMCDRIAVMYLGRIVEIADRETLFANPRHPYTRALIAASLLEENGLLAPDEMLQGDPPSPLNPPTGCHFHPRCSHAEDRCRREAPELAESGPEALVRCHFWNRIGDFAPAIDRRLPAAV